jgi:hypothetical protein
MATAPPRLFGIPASRAPIVAVLRRGPSAWSQVGKWDVERGVYEPGAWIRANLYPQRCDLSPDGRWLCYFTLKASARWKVGPTYIAISRLPWLTALVAWGTCGTWTRGLHFVADRTVWQVQAPAEGDAGPCRKKLGLALTRPAAFAVERRRGWTETPETPLRREGDLWDERRAVTMEKPHPRAGVRARLRVQGHFAAFRSSLPGEERDVRYELVEDAGTTPLDDVQWADWDAEGRLLVATIDGALQIRTRSRAGAKPRSEIDLTAFTPSPSPPPKEAYRW